MRTTESSLMALKASICKVELSIADMDRHYYQSHSLTLAQHPSETDERLMLRLLVFALNADENLQFTKGLSTDDEPDIWQKDLSGTIDHWIELGQPDEKRIKKALGRASKVTIVCYGGAGEVWLKQQQDKGYINKVALWHVSSKECKQLGLLLEKNMTLNCTIQEGTAWLSSDSQSAEITPKSFH